MISKPETYSDKRFWRRGFVRGFIVGIITVLFMFGMVALNEHAFGQNTDTAKEIREIAQRQVLPEGYDKLPYISFADPKGALRAYQEMPQPTYIIIKSSMFSMTNDPKDAKPITLYRIYFTPKPGVSYEVPKNKIVRNMDVGILQMRKEYQDLYTNWSQ